MKNILLNQCGDIAIENGDFVAVEGGDHIRQSWLIRVRTYLGEWYLDANRGIPYTQEIFEKNVTEKRLKDIFRTATLGTEGITSVNQVTIGDIDVAARTISITVDAIMEDGAAGLFVYQGPLDPSNCPISPASDFPATLGDLRIWFDAQDLSTIEYNPGVSLVLTNKAGPGNATGAGTSIPSLIGAGAINNKRAVQFTATQNQRLEIADTAAIRDGSGAVSVIIVYAGANAQTLKGMGGLTGVEVTGTTKEYYEFVTTLAVPAGVSYLNFNSRRVGGSLISGNGTYTAPVTDPGIVIHTIDAARLLKVYRNGTFLNSTTLGAGALRQLDGGGFVGCGISSADGTSPTAFFNGQIGEILVYAEVITDNDRSLLQTYLNTKWGF